MLKTPKYKGENTGASSRERRDPLLLAPASARMRKQALKIINGALIASAEIIAEDCG